MRQSIDIIIPVYSSPNHARVCINSVLREASQPYNLYVINDCSDTYTTNMLRDIKKKQDDITLIEHNENHGYLKSVNEGINESNGEIVILLNSDAALSAGTLDRVRDGFNKNPNTAVISAVSTWANWTRIPFPRGTNRINLSEIVSELGEERLAEIGNASGFFFAVRREIYDALGLFDLVYDPGYWEEADFCMRVLDAGYQVMVDRKLYVFHHGWGSFQQSGRDENMSRNKTTFMDRWEGKYKALEKSWRADNPVADLSDLLNDDFPKSKLKDAEKLVFIKRRATNDDYTISLIQLVNGLVNEGVDSNIIFLEDFDDEIFNLTPMYFRPSFSLISSLDQEISDCDIIISTDTQIFSSIDKIVKKEKSRHFLMAFDFEQDYSFFGTESYKNAEYGYFNCDNILVANFETLNQLNSLGVSATLVNLPINGDIFYTRDVHRTKDILFKFDQTLDRNIIDFAQRLIFKLKEDHDLGISWIGREGIALQGAKYVGNIERLNELASTLCKFSFVVDMSSDINHATQNALQAMACGCVPIISYDRTRTSILKHFQNSILYDVNDLQETIENLMTVFKSDLLQLNIRNNFSKTLENHLLTDVTQQTLLTISKA